MANEIPSSIPSWDTRTSIVIDAIESGSTQDLIDESLIRLDVAIFITKGCDLIAPLYLPWREEISTEVRVQRFPMQHALGPSSVTQIWLTTHRSARATPVQRPHQFRS